MRIISKKICEIYNSEGLYQYFRTQDIYRIKRQYLTEQSQTKAAKVKASKNAKAARDVRSIDMMFARAGWHSDGT